MFRGLIDRIERSSHFGGSVSMPGVPLLELPVPEIPNIQITEQPQPSKPERAASLSGIVLGRLTDLHPVNDALKARLRDMISECAELLDAADLLIEDCHSERRTDLERRHAAIKSEGRKKLKEITTLERRFAEANSFWNAAKETRQERQYDLAQLIENQKGLSQWASDREILDAKIAISQAKEALKAAIEADNRAMQNYSQADSLLASAKATLDEWSKTEAAVRAELAGLPYFDPLTGLASKTGLST